MAWYKLRYDHIVDGKYSAIKKTKAEAMKKAKKVMKRFPYIIVTIYKDEKHPKYDGRTWVMHERWVYSRDFDTKRMKFVQLAI